MSTLLRRSKRTPFRKKCSQHAKATWTVLFDWRFAMGALQ